MPLVGPAITYRVGKRPSLLTNAGRRLAGENFGGTLPMGTEHATQSLRDQCVGMHTPASGDLAEQIIAACIEVRRELGPGLLESIYEECLCDEMTARGLKFERQKPVSVSYKGRLLDQGYRMDPVVESSVLVEVKSVDALLAVHAAQVVTYLSVANLETGLLVNFNALTIRGSLRRLSRTPKNSRSPDLLVKKSEPSQQLEAPYSAYDLEAAQRGEALSSPIATKRRRNDQQS